MECYDHLGNKYNSYAEMYRSYGLDKKTFHNRLYKGWSIGDILTTPIKATGKVCDHLGNKYRSIREMCKVYGISPDTYKNRARLGWDLEKILTTEKSTSAGVKQHGNKRNQEMYDHLGNRYSNKTKLCEAYGITAVTFNNRDNLGWTLKEILTGEREKHHKSNSSHIMESLDDIINQYGLDKTTIKNNIKIIARRLKDCWDIEVALLGDKRAVTLQFIGLNNKSYYRTTWSYDYVTARQIIEHYRPDLLAKYDEYNPTGEYNPYRG